MLKVGDDAPEFTLPDANNKSVSLSDLKGQKVLLWFFPKANTPGWVIEAEGFRDEFQTYKNNNIQVVGCSGDSPKKQKKFVEKYDLPFPMLCDEGHEMLRDYKMWVKKKFMGKEYMGIYRGSYLIDEKGMIEKVYEKVAVKSHTKEVLEDLS